jgi:hypothetical protein
MKSTKKNDSSNEANKLIRSTQTKIIIVRDRPRVVALTFFLRERRKETAGRGTKNGWKKINSYQTVTKF